MKLNSLLFCIGLSLFSNVFATNLHINPQADDRDKREISKKSLDPRFCNIEIINNSFDDVTVFGTYDNGASVALPLFSFDSPLYIGLFYNFYCHPQMHIRIQTNYYVIYSAWTNVNTTIKIVPYLNKQVKAELSAR